MDLTALLDAGTSKPSPTATRPRTPKGEVKPRPSKTSKQRPTAKRQGKERKQKPPKRADPKGSQRGANRKERAKPLATGTKDPGRARILTRVLRWLRRSSKEPADGSGKEQPKWRKRLDPYVPVAPRQREAKKGSRKHKRSEVGPAWEYVEEEAAVDDEEIDEEAEAARKRRARAAAFSVGMARSRKIGMRKNSSTTAQVCAAYPLGVHSAAMDRGVFLGHDTLGGGGAFIYDPFEALEELVSYGVTNTNMMLFGQPGQGKSALIKTMLERIAAVYGTERFTVICDVKGEYDVLAERMGLTRIRLQPGGSVRVNPLEFIGKAKSITDITASRISSVEALATMVMPDRERLNMIEKHVLSMVMEKFAMRPTVQPILSDVVDALNQPTQMMCDQTKMGQWELQKALTPMRLAIQGLLGSQFGGMFNGHSTVTMDPEGPGVVIDISKASSDENALALVWIAASTWLRMLILKEDGRRKIQVFDESWKMVRYEPLALFLQDSWKLARTKGGANIAILHRLSDLSAQAPDGSPTAKMAQGLISDTAVRVTYRQTPRDLAMSAELAGYGQGELARIAQLVPGQSFWKLGDLAVQLDHKLHGRRDEILCDTNELARRQMDERVVS